MRRAWRFAFFLFASASTAGAADFDYSWSAFGTLGYTQSDRPYAYQRFIDNDGTFKRDSVAGLQVDGKLGNEFGATLQVKGAAAIKSDHRYDASVSWAFLSYRPTNDWLFRVGKQRIPVYLFSENYDVGATYDFVRLPTEMYSLVPTNDATSLSFSRMWKIRDGELSLDGFLGLASNNYRIWLSNEIPGIQSSGAIFPRLKYRAGGLIATYKTEDNTFRLALLRASVRTADGSPLVTRYPFVEIGSGVGYYQVSDQQPGPGIGTIPSVINTTVTLGADIALPDRFRFIGEFGRSVVPHSDIAPKANRGYAALLKRVGSWTPYVVYAFLRSPHDQRERFNELNGNSIPAFIPGAALVNASQRAGADQINVYDQSSWSIGSSYAFSATSKLKAEVQRVRIGSVSKLVDSPTGTTVQHQSINVFSLSYSVVFQ